LWSLLVSNLEDPVKIAFFDLTAIPMVSHQDSCLVLLIQPEEPSHLTLVFTAESMGGAHKQGEAHSMGKGQART
jgi:hypothetical protein